MKIGFCMLLWTTNVTEEHRPILEDLKATGYDGVEIPVFEGTPDHYAKLGRMLDEIGLERTAITVIPSLDKNPLGEDAGAAQGGGRLPEILRRLHGGARRQAARRAADADARAFLRQRRRRMRSARGRATCTARPATMRRSSGVQIVIEAVNRFETYFVNTMDDLAAYLDFVDHPAVTGMYDTFHANIEETDPIAAFTRNRRHLSYVHISENDRGVPGRGHVPWAETFRAIKQSGYDGWLTIEAFGRGLPELAAATRVWRDFSEGPEAVYREGFQNDQGGMGSERREARAKRDL